MKQAYINMQFNENVFQNIVENVADGIIAVDTNGLVRFANPAAELIFFRKRDEILGEYFGFPLVDGETEELNIIRTDQQETVAEMRVVKTKWAEENLFLISLRDITERKKLEQALLQAQKKLQMEKEFTEKLLQTAATSIFTVDCNRHITGVNDEFCRSTGYKQEEIVGQPCQILKGEHGTESCNMVTLSQERSITKSQYKIVTKDGRSLTTLKNINLLYNDYCEVIGGIESFIDVTELVEARVQAEKAREEAEYHATTDYLTKLLNRRSIMERLETEHNRAMRDKASLSIILCDLDRFKKINDSYGHQIGDVVLQEVATCISSLCRPYDFAGRYGGEEFIVCLPGTTLDQAVAVAERIRLGIQIKSISVPNQGKNQCLKTTASFGVASVDYLADTDVDFLINRADGALYRAKTEGRNKVVAANDYSLLNN